MEIKPPLPVPKNLYRLAIFGLMVYLLALAVGFAAVGYALGRRDSIDSRVERVTSLCEQETSPNCFEAIQAVQKDGKWQVMSIDGKFWVESR